MIPTLALKRVLNRAYGRFSRQHFDHMADVAVMEVCHKQGNLRALRLQSRWFRQAMLNRRASFGMTVKEFQEAFLGGET